MLQNDPKRSERRRLCLFALCCACACSGGPAEDAAQMRLAVEPYVEELAEYDRWARRLSLADSAFRSEDALEEAAFAPLRRNPRIVAAWLDRQGPDARELRYPEGAPALPQGGWARVRTDALGELDARRATVRVGGQERRCVLVRRSAPAPGGAVLHVTLAFEEAAD